MNHLYRNYKDRPVTSHSYSGGSIFRYCKRRYQLEKLHGWREKDTKASLHFGKCIESALQFHVENKLSGGLEDFTRRWEKIKEIPELKYTEKEGDWAALNVMGQTMLKLFESWWPTSELTNPKWQLQYKKEVFPGNEKYAGLEFNSYVDLRADYKGKPLVVDIKTAAHGLPENPAMLRLDPQLSAYAWVTGIPDVAFLNLIKGGTTFSKGDSATILNHPALSGQQRTVCTVRAETGHALLLSYHDYVQYDQEAKGVKGNALKELKQKWETSGTWMHTDDLTKCRIQFLTCEIPAGIIQESGEIEGQNIVDIVSANERNCWPQDGKGIRFPNNKCTLCPCRGICLGDDKLRDEILVNLGPAAAPIAKEYGEEDWLDYMHDDLF